jgi:hypothetical protein
MVEIHNYYPFQELEGGARASSPWRLLPEISGILKSINWTDEKDILVLRVQRAVLHYRAVIVGFSHPLLWIALNEWITIRPCD